MSDGRIMSENNAAENNTAVRYYSTQRPVSLGTYPSGHKVKEIHNFDERTFVESVGRKAWGWIEFEDELTEKEAANYELVRAEKKKTVSDLLKRNPGMNFSLMTPGGFVDIGADAVDDFLATGKAVAHPGCPGAEFEIDVSDDGILNQVVLSYTVNGGVCRAITDYPE